MTHAAPGLGSATSTATPSTSPGAVARRTSPWRILVRELLETVVVVLLATFAMHALLYFVAPSPGMAAPDGTVGDLLGRYGTWLRRAATFDFGESPYTHRSINGLVWAAAPRTLGLVLLGLAVVIVGHLAAGAWVVFRRGVVARGVIAVVSAVSLVPVYLLAFQVRTGPGGAFMRAQDGYDPGTAALLVVTLGLLLFLSNGLFAESMGTIQQVLRREAEEPYVRSLVSRRIPVGRTLLRNVSALLLGAVAGQLPRLVTSVFILEWAFNIHGIGYEVLRAFDYEGRRDFPVIMAMTFLSVLLVRVLLLVERTAVARLNPVLGLRR